MKYYPAMKMKLWGRLQYRFILKMLFCVKGDIHKKLYVVPFLLYEMFRIGKSIETEVMLVVSRIRRIDEKCEVAACRLG